MNPILKILCSHLYANIFVEDSEQLIGATFFRCLEKFEIDRLVELGFFMTGKAVFASSIDSIDLKIMKPSKAAS